MDLGLRVGANTVSVLAFADDLVLLARDPIAAQMQLDTVVEHLERVGMELSEDKCGGFHVKISGKTWVTPATTLIIRGAAVRTYGVQEEFRYLGAWFSVGRGLDNSSNI